MTVVTKKNFEGLLFAAVLIEILHLVGLFGRRSEVDGVPLALLFTFLIPWVPLALGLGVTRYGRAIAKWLLVGMVVLTWVAGSRVGIAAWWSNPAIFAGAIAGVMQTAAVLMLFTAEGRRWTKSPGTAAASHPEA